MYLYFNLAYNYFLLPCSTLEVYLCSTNELSLHVSVFLTQAPNVSSYFAQLKVKQSTGRKHWPFADHSQASCLTLLP